MIMISKEPVYKTDLISKLILRICRFIERSCHKVFIVSEKFKRFALYGTKTIKFNYDFKTGEIYKETESVEKK